MYSEITEHDITCQLYFLPTEFGGRTKPCFNGYRGQFFYHYNNVGTDWIASYTFENEPIQPGQEVKAKVIFGGSLPKLAKERGMPKGKQVAIREGARIIAVGKIISSKYDYLNKA